MISCKRYIVIAVCLSSFYPASSRTYTLPADTAFLQWSHTKNTVLKDIKDDDPDIVLKPKKYKKGDTLYYCEVLKLSNQDYREHVFAVFGYSYIMERKGRSKIKIKYILNRERNYLSKIFYARAVKIERKRVDVSVTKYMKRLEKKYPNVRMWGVLDANAMLLVKH